MQTPAGYRLLMPGETINEDDLIYNRYKNIFQTHQEIIDSGCNLSTRAGTTYKTSYWQRARKIREITKEEKEKSIKFLIQNRARNADSAIKVAKNIEIFRNLVSEKLIGTINYGYGERFYLTEAK